jgi:hypothetical protein
MLTDTKLGALEPKTAIYRVADSSGFAVEILHLGDDLGPFRLARRSAVGHVDA